MLNSDEFKGKWKEIKGRVREKWAQLTDEDLERVGGKWEELEGILQQKYGHGRDRIRQEITEFQHSLRNKVS